MDWGEITLRLGLATLAGLVIGIDRELRHKAAGMRTHMLVSLGAASIMLVSFQIDATGNATRVVQGIVTGIGFIGAGAILHSGRHTEGVTTAASIWACTMVGVAAGSGLYKIMVASAVLAIFTLSVCGHLETALRRWLGDGSNP
jgi:putative Mg2+ transporter-C (MgtC) family protein